MIKAHLKYLWYVIRHKWYVFLGCIRYQVPLWQAIVHDLSKFHPAEWTAYVNAFYTENGVTENTDTGITSINLNPKALAFAKAWNHHQKTNPHHWQYWTIINDDDGHVVTIPMPENYIREMLADWWGAGKAITGKADPRGWYEKKWRTMYLHTATRERVEKMLGFNQDIVEMIFPRHNILFRFLQFMEKKGYPQWDNPIFVKRERIEGTIQEFDFDDSNVEIEIRGKKADD